MKRVIIVGGGYAGTLLARALDATFDVVLVEPRDAFVHNVAAIRALVDPDLIDQIILPYERLLKRGKVVRDRVQSVTDHGVVLGNGNALTADYVVLATGSTYAKPFKPTTDLVGDFRAASKLTHAAITAARSITIIGAGAVGVELAGEIASAFKGKSITLVSSTPTLFPEFTPGLGKRLSSDLAALGVTIKFGAKAHGFAANDHAQPGSVQLDSGDVIASELIIPAVGAAPTTAVLGQQANIEFDRIGRVAVDPWMRPGGIEGLFAIGDMAANGDMMTIVAASRQAPWLAKTLTALSNGKQIQDLPAYEPWPSPPTLVPLGPKGGASVLPIGRNGRVVGPFLTSAIKGKSLFIPRYHKEFGL